MTALTTILLIASLLIPAAAQSTPTADPNAKHEEPQKSDVADHAQAEDTLLKDPDAEAALTVELSLDDAIRIGIRNNLDVQIEQINADRTARSIAIADAAFDPLFSTSWSMQKSRSPTVDSLSGLGSTTVILVNPSIGQTFEMGIRGLTTLGSTYSLTVEDRRTDTPKSSFFGFNPRNSTAVRLQLSQPLLKEFGHDVALADFELAVQAEVAAEQLYRTQLEATILSITNAYWDYRATREDLLLSQQALREALELLQINRNKAIVGTLTRIDVWDAEANVAAQRSAIIEARNAMRTAKDTLLDLLNYQEILRERGEAAEGLALYEHIRLDLTSELAPTEVHVDLESTLKLAIELRPELRQATADVESAKIELHRSRQRLLPNFSVDGTWSQLGLEESIDGSLREMNKGRFYEWTLGLNFEYAFGNQAARNTLIRAEAALTSAKLTYDRSRHGVILEVTQTVRALEAAYELVQTRREQTRWRRGQLDAETHRLEVGKSTAYQTLQVQNDWIEARTEEIRALVGYRKAIASYKRAAGTIARDVTP